MEELRQQINEIDTQASTLIEDIEDKFSASPEGDHISELLQALHELQAKITEAQEAEGWV